MTFPTFGRLSALGLVLALGACNNDEGKDGDTDTDTTGGGDTDTNTCTSAIKPVLPLNNATDVYYRTPFAVEFTADEHASATFKLVKASDSSEVTLDTIMWSTNGKQASFQAVDPLEPSTAYKLQITYSCTTDAPSEIAFTTSATGSPVADTAAFLGQTYAIDLSTATILQPAGVNALLGNLLGQLDQTIAVVPTEIDESDMLHFYGGLADASGVQDQCTPTIVFPEGAEFENPYFSISAPDGISLTVSGVTINLLKLELSGSFTSDASDIEGLTLAGKIDTRDLVDILGDTLGGATGDDAVCNLVGTFTNNAVQCTDCGDGSTPYCLELVAANIVAAGVDWDLVEITEGDVAEDPECTAPAAN